MPITNCQKIKPKVVEQKFKKKKKKTKMEKRNADRYS